MQDSSSGYDQSDLDEDNIDMETFLDFGDEDSSYENDVVEETSDSPGTADPSSTLARPNTATSDDQAHPLLDHFGKGVVTCLPQSSEPSSSYQPPRRLTGVPFFWPYPDNSRCQGWSAFACQYPYHSASQAEGYESRCSRLKPIVKEAWSRRGG